MIDQRFMDDLAADDIIQTPQVNQDTLLASGPVTSDMPQIGIRVGRAGIIPEQSAKAGGLDRPLIALLDTLAGALHGVTAQTIGLPGDIRSILDMINKEGAQKYLGDPVMPTTERMQEILPAVIPQGVANQADREQTAKMFSNVGTFLPAPGIPEAAIQGVKAVGKAVKTTKGLPVGMSTQAVGEGVDELGFYSAAKQAVDAIQQPKGTGDQFLKQIENTPGVKPDEIKWTGLDEFLKSKKSVTKAEVQEYLAKNRVDIKEVSLADGGLKKKFSVNSPENQDFYDVIDNQGKVVFTGPEDDADYLIDRSLTKFSKYTIPGGENYREILLTLPAKTVSEDEARVILNAKPDAKLSEADIAYASRKKADEFKSSHFDQPNILAHLRVNDRVDVDGKKVLFVEEVQSDWHQAGRKKGYASASKPYEVFDPKDGKPIATFATEKEAKAYADELGPQVDYAKSDGVPDAPFKTTWSDLSMKRVIQMASEGGYDRIAFTTGKTQAERFDLSKQIESVQYKPSQDSKDGKFYVAAIDKQGNSYLGDWYTPKEIENNLGKEISKKIVGGSGNKISGTPEDSTMKELSGLDLQVGGEGMKGFYDDILPKFLNKYAKKWDAKAGMTEIATELTRGAGNMPSMYPEKVPVHYIDITPKMRESTLTKGQPMFAIGAGGAGAAATQTEDNK